MTTSSTSAAVADLPLRETTENDRDELVLKHLPLVRAIAVRVCESLPVHVDVDDLVHAGIVGLFDAATRYSAEKNVAFQAYAKHRIRGAILDSLRKMDWPSRDLRKRYKQMEAVTREFVAANRRNPTDEEIAEKMGMAVSRWRQVGLEVRMVGMLSPSKAWPESDAEATPIFPATSTLNPQVLTSLRQLRSLLSTAMKTLPHRYQTVIGLHYLRGERMREIGDSMGINESRASQIHRSALNKLNVSLQAAGIRSSACLL
jgi:RNA polymerase sigma factor for flagellar operon FliA